MIDGKVGSSVSLIVKRGEEEISYDVKREIIEIQNVSSKVLEEDIGYIKVNVFASNTAEQFSKHLTKLEKKNIQSIIIDLRDNPGGHLLQAREVLDLFFPKKKVLYQIEKNGTKSKVYAKDSVKRSYPVVVLINGDTASSAEVVAACFQDNYKNATIVGVNSYGKGNVQKSLTLKNGTSIKFTIEKWLTAKGKSVSEEGIVPDRVVEQSTMYYVDYLEEHDFPLQESITLLKESH